MARRHGPRYHTRDEVTIMPVMRREVSDHLLARIDVAIAEHWYESVDRALSSLDAASRGVEASRLAEPRAEDDRWVDRLCAGAQLSHLRTELRDARRRAAGEMAATRDAASACYARMLMTSAHWPRIRSTGLPEDVVLTLAEE